MTAPTRRLHGGATAHDAATARVQADVAWLAGGAS